MLLEHFDRSTSVPVVPDLSMFTQEQIAKILAESASGKSTREISAWLDATYGIKASHAKVGRIIREHREERSEALHDKIVEALAPHITTDLDYLSKWQRRLDRAADSLLSEDGVSDVDGAVKILDQLRKYTELKLKHAGATPSDTAKSYTAPVILIPAESED